MSINYEAHFEHNEGDPTCGIITITPALAATMLGYNENNRNLRGRAVMDLARDLVEGNWHLNGETIKISKSGKVLDGQHRLRCIILGDEAMRTFVVTGLEEESQDTMDSGIKRSTGDMFKLNGEKDVNVLSAIVRRCWLWDRGDRKLSSHPVPTKSESAAFLDEHPEIREVARLANRVYSAFPNVSKTAVGIAYYLIHPLDEVQADWFFARLADGAVSDAEHPIVTLRNRMIKDDDTRDMFTSLVLIIRAWNSMREGTSLKKIPIRSGNPIPEPK